MATMVIDVDAIQGLGDNLGTVATEFDNANSNSDQIAAAVGHPGLSSAVHDFAHNWDDKRQKMAKAISSLSQASLGLADAWRQVDQQGADALNGTGQDAPPDPGIPRNQVP